MTPFSDPPIFQSANPYVGPSTFAYEQHTLFFGRESEARDLLAWVLSERLLLFYAQSGAGKSSLLHTRLIPRLQEEKNFVVLPVGRVSGDLPAEMGQVENIFVCNLLLSVDEGDDASRLAHVSLVDFLARLTRQNVPGLEGQTRKGWVYDAGATPAAPGRQRYALILDQFEEIITSHPGRWQEREAFFRQLDAAIQADPNLWVVLVLRDDYVAALDPYAPLVFNRLRARFYMERMGKEAALEAVRQPARLHGQPFASGVAEQLVEDLLQVSVPGQETTVLGQYVEPVQLQVVCYQLWEKLAKDASERQTAHEALLITAENLTAAGDVEQALKEFYGATLALVLADPAVKGVSERRVRSWFDASLITAAGTRGLVQQGETETAGLPNSVVRALQKRFLVRGEVRGGNTWIELVHDRFVEPIRADNAAWFVQHLSTLQRQAALWNEQGRSDGLLLRGEVLAEAAAWAEAQTEPLEKTEQEFLNACKSAERAAEREQEQNRRIRLLAVAAIVIAVFALIAAGLAWQQTQEAQKNAEETKRQTEIAQNAARQSFAENLAGQSQLLLLRADKQFGDLALILARDAALLSESSTISTALRTAADNARLRIVIPSPQRRHQGGVSSVDFSPNGQTIVSGGEDGTVRIWNAADLQPQQLFFNHIGAVTALNFSPNGQRIVSGGEDGTLRIWEVASGQQVAQLDGHEGKVSAVGFSPDGEQIVSGGDTVRVWEVAGGQQVAQLDGHEGEVSAVGFSPDGLRVVSGGEDGTLRIWEVASRQEVAQLDGHEGEVSAVEFSPDGRQIVSGGEDGTLRIWEVASGQQVAQLDGHHGRVSSVEFSWDGEQIISGGDTVRLWEVASRQEVAQLNGHEGEVSAVGFSPDGLQIVSGGKDGTVRIWEVASGIQLTPLDGHVGKVYSLDFSPNGLQIVSGGKDGTLRIWDAASGQQRAQLDSRGGEVYSVRFSLDGRQIVSGGEDGMVRLWDVAGSRQLGELNHGASVLTVDFSPNGRQIVSGGEDGMVRLWDIAGSRQWGEANHGAPVLTVDFSPNGRQIVLGTKNGEVRVWDAVTNEATGALSSGGAVASVSFSPDGQQIVSGGEDGIVRLWSTENLASQEAEMLEGHDGTVYSVGFSPDGRQIVSGGDTVRLWDVASHQEVAQLNSGFGAVASVDFSPNGQQIVSGGEEGTVRIWDSGQEAAQPTTEHPETEQELLQRVIARIFRPAPILTAAERKRFGVDRGLPDQEMLQPRMKQPLLYTQTIQAAVVPAATVVAQAAQGWRNPIDNAIYVYVPAGEFEMGSKNGELDESPPHKVYLDAYWIGQTEVTNAQFRRFVDAGGYATERYWSAEGWNARADNNWNAPRCLDASDFNADDQPVVCVSWYEAEAYTRWLSEKTGERYRLPTEAEWEKAARGTDGRTYPWGNNPPDGTLLNYNENTWGASPAGSYPAGASPYGALDMAGNAWEWVNDWYDRNYYSVSPGSNPQGPATGEYRVLRGGSWYFDDDYVRSANRYNDGPDDWDYGSGFRCVRSL